MSEFLARLQGTILDESRKLRCAFVLLSGLWTQSNEPYLLIVRDSLTTGTTRLSLGTGLALVLGLVGTPAYAAEPEQPSGFAKSFPKYSAEKDRGVEETPTKRTRAHLRSVAAILAAGVPDGIGLGLAYRPAFWTRLRVGGGYNSISPGMRAGLVLIPFSEGPSLTVEGGYYFEGDANSIISNFAGPAYSKTRTLQKVGYEFVNFHAGLDFGSTFATFFLHGGMTYLHTTLHDANDVLGGQTVNSQGEVTTYTFNQDVSLKLWFPSCKLGLLVYIV